MQQPFSNIVCYCELAVKQPFFETSQSCVSTKAFLSHRFKSSPAIPGKVAVPGTAGYMMKAGHFRKSHVSSGDLNRPRSPEVRKPLVYFWYFSYTRKVRKMFLSQEAPRFCKPRISAPQWQLRTATIKTFLRKLRGSPNLESAHQNSKFAQTKLNPFAALASLFLLLPQHFCRFAAESASMLIAALVRCHGQYTSWSLRP